MTTPFTLRPGTVADVPAALELVRELAIYEKAPNEVVVTEADMIRDGFGEKPLFDLIVAEIDQVVIGIALCYVRYSTWKGPILYLEDLVVKENYRAHGIGKALFEACMKSARDKGFDGMAWQVLDWNEPAIRFYNKYNSTFSDEWLNGRLTAAQIDLYFNQNK
ncbi:MAG: GNAT family N-acetyltransferase [Flavobacteriales bacterium]